MNVGARQPGGGSRNDARAAKVDPGFPRLADVGIHSRELKFLAGKGSGPLQSPKSCWLSVTVITGRGSGDQHAQGLPALMRRVHGKHVAHRGNAEVLLVRQIEAVETV